MGRIQRWRESGQYRYNALAIWYDMTASAIPVVLYVSLFYIVFRDIAMVAIALSALALWALEWNDREEKWD